MDDATVPLVPLPRADVRLSRLGFGTAALGNLYAPVDDATATRALHRALDLGVSYLDTAPHYGLGLAEQRISAALTRGDGTHGDGGGDHSARTAAGPDTAPVPVISTKVGRLLRPLRPGETVEPQGFVDVPPLRRVWDFSAEGVRRSLTESLERLELPAVDILLLHDPDDFEAEAVREALPALIDLRKAGVVKAIGAGMNQAEMLTRFVRDFDVDVLLLAGRYTLLEQPGLAELLPLCADRGVGVVIGGTFNSGLLADPRPGARYNYVEASDELLARALAIAAICRKHGTTVTAAALQFPLGHPAVVSVLAGMRSVAQVETNVAAIREPVPESLWAALRAAGLLPPGVPTPGR